MFVPDRILENLRFLIRGAQTQVARTRSYVVQGEVEIEASMRSRDDYLNNLKTFVQRAAFEQAAESEDIAFPTAASAIATNLERIADFCLDIVDQLQHIDPPEGQAHPELAPCFDIIERALGHVERSLNGLDVHEALKVCKAEPKLDDIYARAFQEHLQAMERGDDIHRNVTLLFVVHYFERMGDSLLNIGEAVISASLGEKVKIGQLWALQGSLTDIDSSTTVQDVELEVPGESRSGCRIAMVSDLEQTEATRVFKEGSLVKLQEERDAIELWDSHLAGVAPRVYSFLENGDHAAMLMEYLPGSTLEKAVLSADDASLRAALDRTTQALRSIWETTWSPTPVESTFMQQLERRLPDVFAVHPSFDRQAGRIGSVVVPTLAEQVEALKELEGRCGASFSVLVHGDFNTDNIILASKEDGLGIRLIDLHRSAMGDYLQDASVFLVSNFRLQIFEAPVRQRIQDTMRWFLDFTREQAERWEDAHAETRLGLGLVRSLLTSTRFILDEGFARELQMRGSFLADRLAAEGGTSSFVLPEELFRA